MVLFSGRVSSLLSEKSGWYSIEASDGFELCQTLFPQMERDAIKKNCRMFIELETPTGEKFWFDIILMNGNNAFFDMGMNMLKHPEEVTFRIRRADENSPNTSPDEKKGEIVPTTPKKYMPMSPSNHEELETKLSNITDSTAALSVVSLDDLNNAFNVTDPFSFEDLTQTDGSVKLLRIYIPKTKKGKVESFKKVFVLVDKERFEQYIETCINDNKNPMDICLEVTCRKSGKTKKFPLTAHTWIGSILPHSRCLRLLFSNAAHSESCRVEQLKELKTQLPSLFDQILFWIDDLLNYDEAKWRLETLMEACPKFMSAYHFSVPEARYLGNTIYVEGSTKTLKAALDDLSNQEEVCASNDLATLLMRTFKVDKNFQRNAAYKEKRNIFLANATIMRKGDPLASGCSQVIAAPSNQPIVVDCFENAKTSPHLYML